MSAGAGSGAKHYEFDDDILNSLTGEMQDFHDLCGSVEFKPQWIYVNRSTILAEQNAGYSFIDGYLFGENENFRKRWRVPIGQIVRLSFRAVYATVQTTARGIRLLSEA